MEFWWPWQKAKPSILAFQQKNELSSNIFLGGKEANRIVLS